jgi:hypothetical protein
MVFCPVSKVKPCRCPQHRLQFCSCARSYLYLHFWRPAVVQETLQGAVATRLLCASDEVVSIFHRRLEHGYPTPSLGRDTVLAQALPWLQQAGIWSRGRFGSYKVGVGGVLSCRGGRQLRFRSGAVCVRLTYCAAGRHLEQVTLRLIKGGWRGSAAVQLRFAVALCLFLLLGMQQAGIWSRGRFGSYKVSGSAVLAAENVGRKRCCQLVSAHKPCLLQ